MEVVDPALPIWVQIVATLIPILAAAAAIVKGYGRGAVNPTAVPGVSPMAAPIVMGVGAGFMDRIAADALNDCILAVAKAIDRSTEEQHRFRRALEHHTDLVVEEHARLREETVELRRKIIMKSDPNA